MSHVVRKPVFRCSYHVQHKAGCTATEYGWRLEISDLGRNGIVLCGGNKNTDRLHRYSAPDLCLCLAYTKTCFPMMRPISYEGCSKNTRTDATIPSVFD